MIGEAIMKSAVARLHATGTFHTTVILTSALTSGSWGCGSRIPEEDEQVQLAARDHGSDLLVPSERTAQHLVDVQFEFASSKLPVVPVSNR
jgi:hypothetical protein